jgi:hypothetical protein
MPSRFWKASGNALLPSSNMLAVTASWIPSTPTTALAAWYDPSDLSTLFKDTAGTTPVTADGDSVARMNDKSGNGNHVIQATGASQPIYHTSGGKSWLTFDGTNDVLQTSAAISVTDGSGQHTAFAAVQPTTLTGSPIILSAQDGTNPSTSQFLRINGSNAETIAFNTSGTAFTDVGVAVTATSNMVLSEKTTTTTTEVFVGGTGNGSTAVTGTAQSGSSRLAVGGLDAVAQQPWNGRFYGGSIYKGVLGAGDLSSANTYWNGKF